jgi:dTDP-4-dehydrorhamnose 3,5-epimerase
MKIVQTKIPQVMQVLFKTHTDQRGSFTKVYQESLFAGHQLKPDFAEAYYTISKQGVLRGMHFQVPPHDHGKFVYCILGTVFDVVLDLRVGSPTFGQHDILILRDKDGERNGLYIPKGVAHGFYSMSETTILGYNTTTEHSPNCDTGILWNTFGVNWPSQAPICSQRDQDFVTFSEFKSPFVYNQLSSSNSAISSLIARPIG